MLTAQVHHGLLADSGIDLLAQSHSGMLAAVLVPLPEETFVRGCSTPIWSPDRDDEDLLRILQTLMEVLQ